MKKNRLKKGIGILIIIFIIINFIPTPFYVMSPGIAEELSPIISVEDGYKDQIEGSFLLTAVGSRKATVWDYIYVNTIRPRGYELEVISEQLPEGVNMDKYLQMMENLMEESKLTAEAVALQKIGYEVNIQGDGVEIIEVLENSEAAGKLQSGDIITAIDGKETDIATTAVDLIRNREIGDPVDLEVLRENKKINLTVQTIELPESPGKPSIGILITTKNMNYEFPIEVKYETGDIVGPSAGGMFALEIYNQLVEEDLTKGRRIAGTGTINSKGEIGQIDGIKQKIIAAEEAQAEIFILPKENYEAAKKVKTSLKLIPVETFEEAVQFLTEQNISEAA